MPKAFDIQKFNSMLSMYKQKLRAEVITGKIVRLNNGLTLCTEKDIRLCKLRVMKGHELWKEHFDNVYSIDAGIRDSTECLIRATLSAIGGNASQRAHGSTIKKNLNTGTPWNKGMKGAYPYSYPRSEDAKKKISEANSGKKNGMFGHIWSNQHKASQSAYMKEKILEGKFTPNSNNRNTHWTAKFNGKSYRSSWEAMYQSIDLNAEYETLRITYKYDNADRVYIVDFVNHLTKTVVEVKPKELMSDNKTQAKLSALQNWCNLNKYQMICVDIDWLLGYQYNLTAFDANTARKIQSYETRKKNRNSKAGNCV